MCLRGKKKFLKICSPVSGSAKREQTERGEDARCLEGFVKDLESENFQ